MAEPGQERPGLLEEVALALLHAEQLRHPPDDDRQGQPDDEVGQRGGGGHRSDDEVPGAARHGAELQRRHRRVQADDGGWTPAIVEYASDSGTSTAQTVRPVSTSLRSQGRR